MHFRVNEILKYFFIEYWNIIEYFFNELLCGTHVICSGLELGDRG